MLMPGPPCVEGRFCSIRTEYKELDRVDKRFERIQLWDSVAHNKKKNKATILQQLA